MTLVSDTIFRAVLSGLTLGCGLWAGYDVVLLARLGFRGRGDPVAGDQRFGYMIGIVICGLGIVGTLRFNGVL
jgi:hypothetical protein